MTFAEFLRIIQEKLPEGSTLEFKSTSNRFGGLRNNRIGVTYRFKKQSVDCDFFMDELDSAEADQKVLMEFILGELIKKIQ